MGMEFRKGCQKGKAVGDNAIIHGYFNKEINLGAGMAGNIISNHNIGPDLNELDLEERKRKRVGLNGSMDLDKNFDVTISDSGLSTDDCTESSSLHWLSLLFKLARDNELLKLEVYGLCESSYSSSPKRSS